MKIETLQIDKLTPDPNNARKHDETNLRAIEHSLKEFGQRKPIVVSQEDLIVAGNGTVEAAKRIGWTEIEAVRIPQDWTLDQIKAFAIADNKTAELASWDKAILNEQLAELDKAGWELTEMGFEWHPQDQLENIVEVDLPENTKKRTKLGQIWKLGNHKLAIGDSTQASTYEQLLEGEQVDLVITDPPYNVDYHGGTDKEMTISNDNMSDADFGEFLKKSYDRMIEVSKEGAPIYVFHADSSGHIFRNEFVESGWLLKQVLIWVKNSFVMGRQDYHWQHEPILYGWKPGAGHKWYGDRNKATVIDDQQDISQMNKNDLLELLRVESDFSTVLRENKPKKNGIHPTMKPIILIAKLMSNSSLNGDIVLDPFAGSGSTMIAAEQLGRSARLIELDPEYADAILARWEFQTNQKAELISEG
jgi:site-specific DNA-methyltransferase (adenine-specific)